MAAHEARLDAWAATLHDDVLQPLYALRLCDAHLSPDERAARLGTIADTVHDLVASLAPPVLADFGLVSALHVIAPTADVDLSGTAEADLPAPAARYLFRIVQDALEAAALTAIHTVAAPVVRLGVNADAATLDVEAGEDAALPVVRAASYAHAAGGTLAVNETATGYRVRVPLQH